MQIVPMREFKNTAKIENMCAEAKAPLLVTKNGCGKLVIMDIEYFERFMSKVFEAKLVNECLADLKAEKTVDDNAAHTRDFSRELAAFFV